MKDIESHPLCKQFPLLDNINLAPIAEDISENGLNHPIVLFEGMILDGQNRYAACKLAGVEPTFTEFEGSKNDAMRFVVSENMKRRHMNPTQRAIWAVRFQEWLELNPEFLAVTQKTSKTLGNNHKKAGKFTRRPPNSLEIAADTAKVSESSVKKTAAILETAAKPVIDAMKDGSMTFNKASKLAQKPKSEQIKILKAGPAAIKQAVQEETRNHGDAYNNRPAPSFLQTTSGLAEGSSMTVLAKPPKPEPTISEQEKWAEFFVGRIEACYEKNHMSRIADSRKIVNAIIEAVRA